MERLHEVIGEKQGVDSRDKVKWDQTRAEVLSVAESESKRTESSGKPWVGWRLALGEFGNDKRMFVE